MKAELGGVVVLIRRAVYASSLRAGFANSRLFFRRLALHVFHRRNPQARTRGNRFVGRTKLCL